MTAPYQPPRTPRLPPGLAIGFGLGLIAAGGAAGLGLLIGWVLDPTRGVPPRPPARVVVAPPAEGPFAAWPLQHHPTGVVYRLWQRPTPAVEATRLQWGLPMPLEVIGCSGFPDAPVVLCSYGRDGAPGPRRRGKLKPRAVLGAGPSEEEDPR